MRDTFLKQIADDQRNILYAMIEWNDKESSYRAKIILLKDDGYTVPEIRKMATNHHHDVSIKKWIHSIVSMKKELTASYPENTYNQTNQNI